MWVDEEETNLEIDLNAVSRLKKLKKGDTVTKVSGLEFSDCLKERSWYYYILHINCNKLLKWFSYFLWIALKGSILNFWNGLFHSNLTKVRLTTQIPWLPYSYDSAFSRFQLTSTIRSASEQSQSLRRVLRLQGVSPSQREDRHQATCQCKYNTASNR